MPLAKGSRLGEYELATVIGAGGMGVVYRAHDPRLGRDVAVKVLPEAFSQDPARLHRFEQEARATARLNDPNILAIYDIGTQDGAPFIVSELLDGTTLREQLQHGPLPVRKAIDYTIQIARGLAAAHEQNIIHRDLKPENIFVTRGGRVKILDFGIAKLTQPETSSDSPTLSVDTDAGKILGTVAYMSPEQVKGKQVDARSDLFALGTIGYEMLSGRSPFRAESTAETLGSIVRDEPADLSTSNPTISPGLQRIVTHCLEKNPEERFQAARDVVFALESLSSSTTESAKALATPTRRKIPFATIVAAMLVIGTFAGYAASRFLGRRAVLADFQQITFGHGVVQAARFAPDARTVLFSANWGGNGLEIYSARTDSVGSTQLNLRGAVINSISRSAEALIVQDVHAVFAFAQVGTLARVPITGGTPRPILNDVQDADWAPDGTNFAVSRYVSPKYLLEYPAGHVLYTTQGYISDVRVSPDGKRVAFSDHDMLGDNGGSVAIWDRDSGKLASTPRYSELRGLTWSRDGREVWFSAPGGLRALSLSGKLRDLMRVPGDTQIFDMDERGNVLAAIGTDRGIVMGLGPGQKSERDLSVGDWASVSSITPDGHYVLFDEEKLLGGKEYSTFLRATDGSPPLRLSDGAAIGLSNDGKWAITFSLSKSQYFLVSIGAGEPRALPTDNLMLGPSAKFFPDGKRIAFTAAEPGHGNRLYVQDLQGGNARPVSPEGVRSFGITPDGQYLVAGSREGNAALYPVEGGAPRVAHGVLPGEAIIAVASDRIGYVTTMPLVPTNIYRVDFQTGKRELFKTIAPADLAGVPNLAPVILTPDGKYYAYGYERHLSDLYIIKNLH